ncbi:DNA-binding response regulator, OmpR family, contains REC and winged-helix (wHTH) domain [Butyrivibrio proteoclasticus]|uniref:Stage 0 sporulation protein A homolog n=1 Tax=Butyrivibrio proteoclasticus TaxID=43305 RepID=A0A1I5U3G6_9FIRM|nr:response regulator transcription factor [Butyrivibrio proteoclasticus]SFP89855.1 DNA-binding response regulator, OmpR family, contains REC and winged-helix (wHTH) domain [Butyrivibrio proteoclasticus]
MENILVCDDDKEIVDAIEIYLSQEDFRIYKAYDGIEALEIIKSKKISLAIVDIMMPRMDGMRMVMELRKFSSIPVVFLSAKSEDSDKILGLNIGADDYVTKPFNPLELVARVKSNLRRYTTLGSMEDKENIYKTGGLVIDDNSKECFVDGEKIRLTPIEYNILEFLVKNKGKVYSINQIYQSIWQDSGSFTADNTIAVHIRHIREKIEINPRDPRYLKVVWGVGYKIEDEEPC